VVKWIVLAVIVLALIVLALAAWVLMGRLPALDRAARRLRLRQEQALALQAATAEVTGRIEELRTVAEQAQEKLEIIRVRRGEEPGNAKLRFPAR